MEAKNSLAWKKWVDLRRHKPEIVIRFASDEVMGFSPSEFDDLEASLSNTIQDFEMHVHMGRRYSSLGTNLRIVMQSTTKSLFGGNEHLFFRELLSPGIYIAVGGFGGAIGKKALETLAEEITKILLRWRPFAEKKTQALLSIPIFGPDGKEVTRVTVPAGKLS